MPIPMQITFRNMESSPAIEQVIREHAEKLAEFHDRIMSCRVVVEAPHQHHKKGKLYHLSVDLKIPGAEIAVKRDPSEHHAWEDVNVAIRDAFDALRRRLQDEGRKRRGDIKIHEAEPHGTIARLFPYEGYGFITSSTGDEVYFHRNAVIDGNFDKLEVGNEVRFNPEMGEKGLQATKVQIVGKHHLAG